MKINELTFRHSKVRLHPCSHRTYSDDVQLSRLIPSDKTTKQQNNKTTKQQNNKTTKQQNNKTTTQQNNKTTKQQQKILIDL